MHILNEFQLFQRNWRANWNFFWALVWSWVTTSIWQGGLGIIWTLTIIQNGIFRRSKCLIWAYNGYYCFKIGYFGFVPKSCNSRQMDPFLSWDLQRYSKFLFCHSHHFWHIFYCLILKYEWVIWHGTNWVRKLKNSFFHCFGAKIQKNFEKYLQNTIIKS